MDHEIVVTTGSRLHFGLLSNDGDAGRQFGGLGVMIDRPGFQITVGRDEIDRFLGPEEFLQRARQFVARYRERTPPDRQPPASRLQIARTIPSHVGLGSGTQLAMAVARGLAEMAGETNVATEMLACRVGRGRRSAVGIHGFETGGLLVDGGKAAGETVGSLAARIPFPEKWRFLLVRPPEVAGFCGDAEEAAFAELPPTPKHVTDHLCRLIVMELLPAAAASDFSRFAEALYEYGSCVGETFAAVQRGTYADSRMAELVGELRRRGIAGVGQTSWGPTLFVLCRDATSAEQLESDLASQPQWRDCRFQIAAAMNAGATVDRH